MWHDALSVSRFSDADFGIHLWTVRHRHRLLDATVRYDIGNDIRARKLADSCQFSLAHRNESQWNETEMKKKNYKRESDNPRNSPVVTAWNWK